jgi:hypothetical protein
MLAGLWLCFGLLAIPSYEVSAVLQGFTALFLVASPLIGIFLGSGPQGFDSTTFTTTRPLTDGDFAAATLRCAVVSVGSAAVIWLVGSLAAMAIWGPEAWQVCDPCGIKEAPSLKNTAGKSRCWSSSAGRLSA